MASVPQIGVVEAFFLDLVLTFILLFVISAVATDPTSASSHHIDHPLPINLNSPSDFKCSHAKFCNDHSM
jgi:glycerol uptake facilitator-like aquaporin